MAQKAVVTIDDITRVDFEDRRTGCGVVVMHEDAPVKSLVFRVAPGSGVPRHLHSQVYDIFLGIKGLLEIRYEGQHGHGIFELRPGAFCAMPPGVKHEVYNPGSEDAFFFLVHAPHQGYDYVPVDFRHLQAALENTDFRPTSVR